MEREAGLGLEVETSPVCFPVSGVDFNAVLALGLGKPAGRYLGLVGICVACFAS